MAYDEALADRVRGVLGDHPRLREQKMFGGLAFLIAGNMARSWPTGLAFAESLPAKQSS